jgi:hypothetical protein
MQRVDMDGLHEACHEHAHPHRLTHLGVRPGEKITVDKLPDGRLEMKAVRPTGKISDGFDFFEATEWPILVDRGNQRSRHAGLGRQVMKIDADLAVPG